MNLGADWEVSSSWFFNSGLPFTPIVGYYDKLYMDNLYNVGSQFGSYIPFTILGDRNIGRLPTYHRLDFGITKKLEIYLAKIFLSLNIIKNNEIQTINAEKAEGKRRFISFIPNKLNINA